MMTEDTLLNVNGAQRVLRGEGLALMASERVYRSVNINFAKTMPRLIANGTFPRIAWEE